MEDSKVCVYVPCNTSLFYTERILCSSSTSTQMHMNMHKYAGDMMLLCQLTVGVRNETIQNKKYALEMLEEGHEFYT